VIVDTGRRVAAAEDRADLAVSVNQITAKRYRINLPGKISAIFAGSCGAPPRPRPQSAITATIRRCGLGVRIGEFVFVNANS
jgi:hypothetical protein